MPDDTELLLREEPAESPAARRKAPRRQPEMPPRTPSALGERPRSSHRPWLRWALFLLLPLVLLAGGYWYVAGGQVMSTDDAYVEADKVGVSTDVSGIVKDVDVTENQYVEAGRVLYRLSRWSAPRHKSAWSRTRSTRSRRTTGTYRRRSSRRSTTSTITTANSAASRPS